MLNPMQRCQVGKICSDRQIELASGGSPAGGSFPALAIRENVIKLITIVIKCIIYETVLGVCWPVM
jgi:hypothetical protein